MTSDDRAGTVPVTVATTEAPRLGAQTAAHEWSPLVTGIGVLDTDLGEVADADVVDYIALLSRERAIFNEKIDRMIDDGKRELVRRLHRRNAKAIAHNDYDVVLLPVYTEYLYDYEALYEAQNLLPEEEAAKILKRVPEQTVPAHFEPGNARSIVALQKRYGIGTPVGDLLAAGMRRDKVDEKLTIKPRKG